MKRYEKYKNSGFEWYGDIPSHWKLSPMKHLFEIRSGATPNTGEDQYWDGGIKWITPADFKTEDYHVNGGRKSISQRGLESCTASLLPIGSIVFSKRAPIGSVAITTDLLCTNQGCLGCIPFDVDSRFYYYSMSCLKNQFELFGSGTTFKEISATDFSNFMMLCPPLREQQVIADSLDSQCSKIDEMIEAKSKQIDDLKDYRKSLISEVVTKGLNPNVEMKESGIEGLGEIPSSWSVISLKYLLSEPLKYGASESGDDDYREGYLRYIRITDITEESALKDLGIKYLSPKQAESYLVKKGDILFARSGATVGKTFLYEEDETACFAGYLIKATCSDLILPKYLFQYTRSSFYENWKNASFSQATIQNIGADKYCNLPVALPSIEEQLVIVAYLDDKCSKIADLMKMLGDEIEELKKYKTSIISEAVTGKIRVC